MKFYDRTSEITALRQIEQASAETAQMTMIIGRRRVGKTTLLKNAFKATPVLYFFVAKKNEVLLCQEFAQEIGDKLGIPVGSYSSFAELFRAVMQLSERINFTLIIDEFQEFRNINSSVFSDMQQKASPLDLVRRWTQRRHDRGPAKRTARQYHLPKAVGQVGTLSYNKL